MINISQSLKNACNSDKINYREYVVLDGTTTQIDVKTEIYSTAYKDTHFIGTFNMKYIKFTTQNDVQFRKKELTLYKEINGESFKIGNFIVTDINDNDSNEEVSVTAYDYGLKFANPYETSLNYASGTITLKDVLDEICTKTGVELANTSITNGDFIVDSNQFVNGELYGDVVSAIAFITGDFATINNEDKLELIFNNQTNEIIEDYVDLDDKRDTQPITSLSIGTSQVEGQNAVIKDDELIAQYGEHWLVINDDPFAYTLEKREALKTAIFNKVKGFGYSAFKSEYSFKPYLTLGDLIQFRNKEGQLVNSVILKITSNYDNITLEAPSVTKATIEYETPENAIETAKKAEIIANQSNSTINMITNQIDGNYILTSDAKYLDKKSYYHLIDGEYVLLEKGQDYNVGDAISGNVYEFDDGLIKRIKGVETKQSVQELQIDIFSKNIDKTNGDIKEVTTTNGFTFNSDGLNISTNQNEFNTLIDNKGTYYKDGDSIVSQTTKDGTISKDMVLYGKYYYGVDDDLQVSHFTKEDAMFIAETYIDNNGEKGFGHFYNGV